MKTIITIFLFGILCFTTTAQETSTRQKHFGGFGYSHFSTEQFQSTGLNNLLKTEGYSPLPSVNTSFGGGGMFVIGNFMVGGGGAWLPEKNVSNDVNALTVKGGYGMFNLGYLVFKTKRTMLYPALGVGGGGYDLLVQKKQPSTDFASHLNSPQDMLAASAGGLLVSAEATYQYFFNREHTQGFFIGLKGGYKYAPANWRFGVNGQNFNQSPSINMTGWYVTIIIGGGSVATAE